MFEAIPFIFITTRGFNSGEAGLVFIGVGVGTTIGAYLTIPLSKHYPRLIVKYRGFPPPEERLYGAMIGGPMLVIGAFWLGWTGQYASIPWIVPALATVPIGAAVSLVFNSFLSYLVDTYLQYAASAFSANTIVRSCVGAAFPLFTVQMFRALGIAWACTLVGLCGLLLAPSPFLFYRYGPWVRAKSKFSPCPVSAAAAATAAVFSSRERVADIGFMAVAGPCNREGDRGGGGGRGCEGRGTGIMPVKPSLPHVSVGIRFASPFFQAR